MLNSRFLPTLALFLSVIGVSSALTLVRLSDVNPSVTLMLRMLFSWFIVFAWRIGRKDDSTENIQSATKIDYALLLLSGVLSCVDLLSNHWAVEFTSVANANILMNLSPAFVVLFSWLFFQEKFSFMQLVALFMALVGSGLVILSDTAGIHSANQPMFGNLLALNSAVFYAIYLLLIKRLRLVFDAKKIIMWNSLTIFILMLSVLLPSVETLLPQTLHGFVIIIMLAIISQIIGHGLMIWALKHVTPSLAIMSSMARPVSAIILAWIILGESVTNIQMLGGAIVIVSIFVFNNMSFVKKTVVKTSE